MDQRVAACCIRGMRHAPILLAVTMLSGCGYYSRSPGQQVTAADPTTYSAPAEGAGRYLPWRSGWSYGPPMAVGQPLVLTPPARSTPERDPTGSLPSAP